MLTAGVRPAEAVRLAWAVNAAQSTGPPASNGSKIADAPEILRRGRSRPIGSISEDVDIGADPSYSKVCLPRTMTRSTNVVFADRAIPLGRSGNLIGLLIQVDVSVATGSAPGRSAA